MITVFVNQQAFEMSDQCTLAQALEQLGYMDETFAVALNKTFIPGSRYSEVILHDQDHLDVLFPMQGG